MEKERTAKLWYSLAEYGIDDCGMAPSQYSVLSGSVLDTCQQCTKHAWPLSLWDLLSSGEDVHKNKCIITNCGKSMKRKNRVQ